MMTRNRPVAAFSFRDLLPLACAFIGVSSATFAVACYAQERLPIADFLHRAQSEINARRFERLLSTLGKKPNSAVSHHEEKSVAVTNMIAASTTSAPASIEAVAASAQALATPGTTEGRSYAKAIAARLEKPHQDEAKVTTPIKLQLQVQPQPKARPKRIWTQKASGYLRRFGVRF